MWGYIVLVFAISLTLFSSLSYASIPDSPIAYYEFDDDVLDSSGNEIIGTISDGVGSFVDGKVGTKAFDFESTRYITTANHPFDFEKDSEFSFSYWIKTDTGVGRIIAKNDPGFHGIIHYFRSAGQPSLFLYDSNNIFVEKELSRQIDDNVWYHIVVTYDGSGTADGINYYVDGILDTNTSIITNSAGALTGSLLESKLLTIGASSQGTHILDATLDDLRIHTSELDTVQITELFNVDTNHSETNVMFDQSIFAMDHSGILTIVDSTISDNSIEAIISSDIEPPITVALTRLNSDDPFKSYPVKFTSTLNPSTNSPELAVSLDSTIDVQYNGISYTVASIVSADNLLDENIYDYNKNTPFLIANPCPETAVIDGVSFELGGDDDKDGICDAWEQGGYIVNYPDTSSYKLCDVDANYNNDPLGGSVCPSLTKKDIYVEIDYMEGHAPNMESLQQVVTAFDNAPSTTEAPDGFQLHIVVDEQILPHINQIKFESDPDIDPGFNEIKAQTFGTESERDDNWIESNELAKSQVFYYYLWIHDRAEDPGSSGYAESGGNDGIMSLGSFDGHVGTMDQQAGTFMHELGHNFGLDHGGDNTDLTNCKPNLLSVMSYSRQYSDLVPDRSLDFSRQAVGNFSDPNSKSLGMEHQLTGIGPYSSNPDSQIIFGMGGGETQLENVNQNNINWPQNWQDVRTIVDSDGREVCSPVDPTEDPQDLDGIDQWSIIDLSRKGADWRDGRSLNPQTILPLNISTDKSEYLPGEDIEITGNNAKIQSFKVTVEILPSSLSYVEFTGESDVQNDKSFKHKFHDVSPNTGSGNYIIKATHGTDEYSTMIYIGDDANPFSFNSQDWCMSENEIKSLTSKYDLNESDFLDSVRLCNTSYSNQDYEIDMDNVRAARSVNVDNVLSFVERLDKNDFKKSKDNLKNDIDNIRNLFLEGKKIKALEGYIALKTTVDNTITDENLKQDFIAAIPIESTIHTLDILDDVSDDDFTNPQDDLIHEIESIRTLVLNDQMVDTLQAYQDLKISVENKVTNDTAKQELITIIDRNIDATYHAVPEFETIAILILIVSIISVIIFSRKISIFEINYK